MIIFFFEQKVKIAGKTSGAQVLNNMLDDGKNDYFSPKLNRRICTLNSQWFWKKTYEIKMFLKIHQNTYCPNFHLINYTWLFYTVLLFVFSLRWELWQKFTLVDENVKEGLSRESN